MFSSRVRCCFLSLSTMNCVVKVKGWREVHLVVLDTIMRRIFRGAPVALPADSRLYIRSQHCLDT